MRFVERSEANRVSQTTEGWMSYFAVKQKELGMSDYQIRKWQSWHTHHAIVMIASLYIITTQLIEKQKDVPLLSFRDAQIMLVANICATQVEIEDKALKMNKRHKKRKTDIYRAYQKQREKLKS